MLQYLVIVLDDASVAYCHADNPLKERNLMSLETLKKGILFGMKQNLMIQYVFPDYALPREYSEVIESIDNVKIYPFGCKPVTGIEYGNDADVEVANAIPNKVESKNLVLRLAFSEMLAKKDEITKLFASGTRINLCITDVEQFTDELIETYKQVLNEWNAVLLDLYKQGQSPQFNLLTDRMMLEKMHNCEAGVSNITFAPNGKFYLCPAFYYDEQTKVDNQLTPPTDIGQFRWKLGERLEYPQSATPETRPCAFVPQLRRLPVPPLPLAQPQADLGSQHTLAPAMRDGTHRALRLPRPAE